eukprot:m.379343 g.379343  ORF g.379343 m.379343 type:complete len:223 (+) comp20951_c0_seq5:261-929(+)
MLTLNPAVLNCPCSHHQTSGPLGLAAWHKVVIMWSSVILFSAGQIFNAVSDTCINLKQQIRVIATALGRPDFQIFELPLPLAVPARPLNPGITNDAVGDGGFPAYFFTNDKAKRLLGYKDKVGLVDAYTRTARWLAAEQNHVPMSVAVKVLHDPFDYANEDLLLHAWYKHRDWHACLAINWPITPGWGHFHYGPGVNPGDAFHGNLQEKYAGKYDRDMKSRL